MQNVITIVTDLNNQYFFRVPILLEDMLVSIKKQLKLETPNGCNKLMRKWHDLADTYDRILDPVNCRFLSKSS